MIVLPQYALTLWPEWVITITHLGKRVENRTRKPPQKLIGKRVALHASKTLGGGNSNGHKKQCRALGPVEEYARRAGWRAHRIRGDKKGQRTVLVVKKDGKELSFSASPSPYMIPIHTGAIVAVARITDFSRFETDWARNSPWAFPGWFQWKLEGVEVLKTPIPIKGRQQHGWALPPELVGKEVEEQ